MSQHTPGNSKGDDGPPKKNEQNNFSEQTPSEKDEKNDQNSSQTAQLAQQQYFRPGGLPQTMSTFGFGLIDTFTPRVVKDLVINPMISTFSPRLAGRKGPIIKNVQNGQQSDQNDKNDKNETKIDKFSQNLKNSQFPHENNKNASNNDSNSINKALLDVFNLDISQDDGIHKNDQKEFDQSDKSLFDSLSLAENGPNMTKKNKYSVEERFVEQMRLTDNAKTNNPYWPLLVPLPMSWFDGVDAIMANNSIIKQMYPSLFVNGIFIQKNKNQKNVQNVQNSQNSSDPNSFSETTRKNYTQPTLLLYDTLINILTNIYTAPLSSSPPSLAYLLPHSPPQPHTLPNTPPPSTPFINQQILTQPQPQILIRVNPDTFSRLVKDELGLLWSKDFLPYIDIFLKCAGQIRGGDNFNQEQSNNFDIEKNYQTSFGIHENTLNQSNLPTNPFPFGNAQQNTHYGLHSQHSNSQNPHNSQPAKISPQNTKQNEFQSSNQHNLAMSDDSSPEKKTCLSPRAVNNLDSISSYFKNNGGMLMMLLDTSSSESPNDSPRMEASSFEVKKNQNFDNFKLGEKNIKNNNIDQYSNMNDTSNGDDIDSMRDSGHDLYNNINNGDNNGNIKSNFGNSDPKNGLSKSNLQNRQNSTQLTTTTTTNGLNNKLSGQNGQSGQNNSKINQNNSNNNLDDIDTTEPSTWYSTLINIVHQYLETGHVQSIGWTGFSGPENDSQSSKNNKNDKNEKNDNNIANFSMQQLNDNKKVDNNNITISPSSLIDSNSNTGMIDNDDIIMVQNETNNYKNNYKNKNNQAEKFLTKLLSTHPVFSTINSTSLNSSPNSSHNLSPGDIIELFKTPNNDNSTKKRRFGDLQNHLQDEIKNLQQNEANKNGTHTTPILQTSLISFPNTRQQLQSTPLNQFDTPQLLTTTPMTKKSPNLVKSNFSAKVGSKLCERCENNKNNDKNNDKNCENCQINTNVGTSPLIDGYTNNTFNTSILSSDLINTSANDIFKTTPTLSKNKNGAKKSQNVSKYSPQKDHLFHSSSSSFSDDSDYSKGWSYSDYSEDEDLSEFDIFSSPNSNKMLANNATNFGNSGNSGIFENTKPNPNQRSTSPFPFESNTPENPAQLTTTPLKIPTTPVLTNNNNQAGLVFPASVFSASANLNVTGDPKNKPSAPKLNLSINTAKPVNAPQLKLSINNRNNNTLQSSLAINANNNLKNSQNSQNSQNGLSSAQKRMNQNNQKINFFEQNNVTDQELQAIYRQTDIDLYHALNNTDIMAPSHENNTRDAIVNNFDTKKDPQKNAKNKNEISKPQNFLTKQQELLKKELRKSLKNEQLSGDTIVQLAPITHHHQPRPTTPVCVYGNGNINNTNSTIDFSHLKSDNPLSLTTTKTDGSPWYMSYFPKLFTTVLNSYNNRGNNHTRQSPLTLTSSRPSSSITTISLSQSHPSLIENPNASVPPPFASPPLTPPHTDRHDSSALSSPPASSDWFSQAENVFKNSRSQPLFAPITAAKLLYDTCCETFFRHVAQGIIDAPTVVYVSPTHPKVLPPGEYDPEAYLNYLVFKVEEDKKEQYFKNLSEQRKLEGQSLIETNNQHFDNTNPNNISSISIHTSPASMTPVEINTDLRIPSKDPPLSMKVATTHGATMTTPTLPAMMMIDTKSLLKQPHLSERMDIGDESRQYNLQNRFDSQIIHKNGQNIANPRQNIGNNVVMTDVANIGASLSSNALSMMTYQQVSIQGTDPHNSIQKTKTYDYRDMDNNDDDNDDDDDDDDEYNNDDIVFGYDNSNNNFAQNVIKTSQQYPPLLKSMSTHHDGSSLGSNSSGQLSQQYQSLAQKVHLQNPPPSHLFTTPPQQQQQLLQQQQQQQQHSPQHNYPVNQINFSHQPSTTNFSSSTQAFTPSPYQSDLTTKSVHNSSFSTYSTSPQQQNIHVINNDGQNNSNFEGKRGHINQSSQSHHFSHSRNNSPHFEHKNHTSSTTNPNTTTSSLSIVSLNTDDQNVSPAVSTLSTNSHPTHRFGGQHEDFFAPNYQNGEISSRNNLHQKENFNRAIKEAMGQQYDAYLDPLLDEFYQTGISTLKILQHEGRKGERDNYLSLLMDDEQVPK
jgi:hypothetical protein